MADRALFLARTLMTRLARLRTTAAEEGQREPDRAQRLAVIEKVLAVELGVTDGATLALVEAAAPQGRSDARGGDRELQAFAEFLRQRLATPLAET
jgi:hypothetical protein